MDDRLDGLLSAAAPAPPALAGLPAQARAVAAAAVRDAAARGTARALACVAVIAGAGAVLCLLMPRERPIGRKTGACRRRSRPAASSVVRQTMGRPGVTGPARYLKSLCDVRT